MAIYAEKFPEAIPHLATHAEMMREMATSQNSIPEAIPHLAKHAEMMREMATSQNSNAWFVYDQRVRMDRQARGLPWEDFNMEFYIMAARARDSNFSGTFVTRDNTFLNCGCNSPFRGFFRPSYIGAMYSRNTRRTFRNNESGGRYPGGLCWSFNRDGFCKVPNCRFSHKCSQCGEEHSVLKCLASKHKGNNNSNQPNKE